MAFLADPSEIYRDSFFQAFAEFRAEGDASARSAARGFSLKEVAEHFETFVHSLRDQADPMKVKPGWIPTSELWLIDEGAYVGWLSLRHTLGESLLQIGGHVGYAIRPARRGQGYGRRILQLGRERAKALGLQRILLTCDENNLASRKVIEANTGVLENIIVVENWPERICRYWIYL